MRLAFIARVEYHDAYVRSMRLITTFRKANTMKLKGVFVIAIVVWFQCTQAMSNEQYEEMYFSKPIWSGIVLCVRDAQAQWVLDEYLTKIYRITTNLHTPDEYRHYLLGELLIEAVSDACYRATGPLAQALLIRCRNNCAYILKELIKSGKIKPQESDHGRVVCSSLDQQFNQPPGTYFNNLQSICNQVAQGKIING